VCSLCGAQVELARLLEHLEVVHDLHGEFERGPTGSS
jgi:hypothetical protein